MIFRKDYSNTIVNWWFSWKTARHPWMKARKRWKTLVIHGWKRKNDEKCSSSMDESEKTMKNARHPWMKARKRWKVLVIRGWKWKNGENRLSTVDSTLAKGGKVEWLFQLSHNAISCRLQRPLLQSYLFPYISFMMASPTLAR